MKSLSIKEELFRLGVNASKAFLIQNSIAPVRSYKNCDLPGDTGLCSRVGGKTDVYVNVLVTAFPRSSPVCCMRSHPGHKIDRTAIGVVAHETGHHIDFELSQHQRFNHAFWKVILKSTQKRVSGYEPSPSEAWAETFRLFMLNPTLLLEGLPERYKFINSQLGLVSLQKKHWTEVLPESFHQDARSWIKKER